MVLCLSLWYDSEQMLMPVACCDGTACSLESHIQRGGVGGCIACLTAQFTAHTLPTTQTDVCTRRLCWRCSLVVKVGDQNQKRLVGHTY